MITAMAQGLGGSKRRPPDPMDFFREAPPPSPEQVARKVMVALGHPSTL